MRGTGHRLQHGAPVSAGTSVQGTKFTYIDRTMKVCMASFPHFRNFFVAPRAFLRVSSDFRLFDTNSHASSQAAGRHSGDTPTWPDDIYMLPSRDIYYVRVSPGHTREKMQSHNAECDTPRHAETADRLRRLLHTHQFLNRARFFQP